MQQKSGVANPNMSSKRKGNSGRKGIAVEELRERLTRIPLNARTTQRRLAAALGIPQSTLHHNLKALGLKVHSSAIKPYLKQSGNLERLRWVLRWVRSSTSVTSTATAAADGGSTRVLHDFEDFVHVDEKWFYLFHDGQRFYLYDGEEPPVRKVQSKRFITKVMFLAAVARPRHNTSSNFYFDCKIGLCTFTEKVRVVRNSRNREAGTLVTKPVEVTRETYKAKLIDDVIPAIKAKWPAASRRSTIFLQQDNAPPHRVNTDGDLLEACSSDGFDIKIINQSPNSPDTNILDLGFFAAIQSLQDRTRARTIDELIAEVETAWQAVPAAKLDRVWTSLNACMEQILLCGGDNTYKLPHSGKGRSARAGETIPRRYQISEESWTKGNAVLSVGGEQRSAA